MKVGLKACKTSYEIVYNEEADKDIGIISVFEHPVLTLIVRKHGRYFKETHEDNARTSLDPEFSQAMGIQFYNKVNVNSDKIAIRKNDILVDVINDILSEQENPVM